MLIRSLVVFAIALCALPVFAGTVKTSSAGPLHALTVDLTSLSLDSTSLHGVQTQCWQGTGFSAGEVTGVLRPVKVISIDALTTSSITVNFRSDSQAFSNVVCVVTGGSGGGSVDLSGVPADAVLAKTSGVVAGDAQFTWNSTAHSLALGPAESTLNSFIQGWTAGHNLLTCSLSAYGTCVGVESETSSTTDAAWAIVGVQKGGVQPVGVEGDGVCDQDGCTPIGVTGTAYVHGGAAAPSYSVKGQSIVVDGGGSTPDAVSVYAQAQTQGVDNHAFEAEDIPNGKAMETHGGKFIIGDYRLILTPHTPASSSEACQIGTFAIDTSGGFLDLCTATNTWKRIALSSF